MHNEHMSILREQLKEMKKHTAVMREQLKQSKKHTAVMRKHTSIMKKMLREQKLANRSIRRKANYKVWSQEACDLLAMDEHLALWE